MPSAGALDGLVAAARRRVRRDARIEPLGDLRRAVARLPEAPRFESALRYADRLAIIAELKRASPSAGDFGSLGEGSAAALELARRYAASGAICLSVLTEPTRFRGSDSDLEAASRAGLPVLRKDFVVDRYQVWQARTLGAGAVLLIARIQPGEALRELVLEAGEAGIDALVEVHDESDLERGLAADATLIGVNARDLATLEIDLGRAARLLEAARESGATLVAESGVSGEADLRQVASAGAHAVLIGTALLRSADPAARLAELNGAAPRRSPTRVPAFSPRVAVKTCGLRDEAGVKTAASADADLAGFVVAPDSPRRVTPQRAGELARALSRSRPVLVFRSPSESDVRDALASSSIEGAQLAGFDAPPSWTRGLAGEVQTLIGVVHQPRSARSAVLAAEAWYAAGATHVLLEGATAAKGGGQGGEAPTIALVRRVNRVLPAGLSG